MCFILCHLLELLIAMDSGCSKRTTVDTEHRKWKGICYVQFNLFKEGKHEKKRKEEIIP